jgi:hypothetical protein
MLHMCSHIYYKRISQMFHLFQMYVAFERFMLQVQTASVGVHEGRPSRGHRCVEEAYGTAGGVGEEGTGHA